MCSLCDGGATALVVGAWAATRIDRVGLRVGVPVAVVVLLGGALLGSGSDWQRVPGPYLAGAEQRSVDAETMAVAQWSSRYLPAGSRIAADVTIGRVLPTVAPVDPVTSASGSVNMTEVFVTTSLDTARELLVEGGVDFLYVDTRMVGQTVRSGSYYEGSSFWGPVAMTLDTAQLGKFAGAAGFDLVLDGPVQVYDLRSLRDEPSVFTDRPAAGLPGSWTPWQALLVGSAALALLALVVVRRRERSWQTRDAVPVLLAIPALVLAGVLAPLADGAAAKGTVLALLGLLAAGVLLWRCTEPGRPEARSWLWLLPALGLAVAVALTCYAAWFGLFDSAPLAPPASVPVSGTLS